MENNLHIQRLYTVMPFGLPLCVKKLVRWVLQKLAEQGICMNNVQEVKFCGYMVGQEGVRMSRYHGRSMSCGPAKSNTMQSAQHPQHRMAARMAEDKVQAILD